MVVVVMIPIYYMVVIPIYCYEYIYGSYLEESNSYTFFLSFHTVNSALQKLRKPTSVII